MIIGTGIDIIRIDRLEHAAANPRFLARVFTAGERGYAAGRGKQGAASLAARWAAKEAILKALGTGLAGGALTDMEILPDEQGKPVGRFAGEIARRMAALGVKRAHLSLSHEREYAIAHCILED